LEPAEGAEAQRRSRSVAADPKMADAQYLLGMVLINQGKLPSQETVSEYMKLEPKARTPLKSRRCLT